MGMRSDAGACRRHSACRLAHLDRRYGFGGAGRRSDWEKVRSGVDRAPRQHGRQGRIGRRWGFGKRKMRMGLFRRHFSEWTTLVKSIDLGGHY